jgi:hypothetical protein
MPEKQETAEISESIDRKSVSICVFLWFQKVSAFSAISVVKTFW